MCIRNALADRIIRRSLHLDYGTYESFGSLKIAMSKSLSNRYLRRLCFENLFRTNNLPRTEPCAFLLAEFELKIVRRDCASLLTGKPEGNLK
jgi:hypothetical protein